VFPVSTWTPAVRVANVIVVHPFLELIASAGSEAEVSYSLPLLVRTL
jgi:hypothetical protein